MSARVLHFPHRRPAPRRRRAAAGDGRGRAGVDPDLARLCARTCAVDALAAVAATLGSLDRVTRVVTVTGFVASDPGSTGHAGVLDGASKLLGDLFGQAGVHARSAVGVAVLPLDFPVGMELTVEFS